MRNQGLLRRETFSLFRPDRSFSRKTVMNKNDNGAGLGAPAERHPLGEHRGDVVR